MKSFTHSILPRAVASLALAFGLAGGVRAESGKPPSLGERFPSLATFGLEGRLPDLGQAKVVIVDFWASWCGPCKASFPIYEELRRQYGDRGLVIVAVSVDQDRKAMEKFVAHQNPGFAIVRDADQKLVQAVAPPTMPTSFVLDAQGVVRAVHHGFHGEKTQREYVEEINRLLGAAQ